MKHLAFYDTGCEHRPGLAGLKPRMRRAFRRLLLPLFHRLVEILASLCRRLDVAEYEVRDLKAQVDDLRRRHEDQAAKIPAIVAFGWDYVAMVRRLAALEEHVDALLAERNAVEPDHSSGEALVRLSVGSDPDPTPRAKVG